MQAFIKSTLKFEYTRAAANNRFKQMDWHRHKFVQCTLAAKYNADPFYRTGIT